MKKRLVPVLLAVLLLMSLVFSSACAVTVQYVKTNRGGPLLVRAEAKDNAVVWGKLAYGAPVTVEWVKDGWARILFGNYGSAFVKAAYLSPDAPTEEEQKAALANSTVYNAYSSFVPANYDALVTPAHPSGFVEMRWEPKANGLVMQQLFYGEKVMVLAQNATWCQIYIPEMRLCGYLEWDYLAPLPAEEAIPAEEVIPTEEPGQSSSPALEQH